MSTKSITGTGLLLAVALLAQSLRLMFPFIPNQVSMFLIGSITSATFVLAEVEHPMLDMVMQYTRGNQTRAANMLGINRGTLRKKLKKYGMG